MGEVADALTKKRKKKGRPSLIEVQKRALKQQQLLLQNKEEARSGFRNPNSAATGSSHRIYNPSGEEEEEEDDDERRDKKHRLLHGLNSHDHDRRRGDSSNLQSNGCELDASATAGKIGGNGSDVTVVTEFLN